MFTCQYKRSTIKLKKQITEELNAVYDLPLNPMYILFSISIFGLTYKWPITSARVTIALHKQSLT